MTGQAGGRDGRNRPRGTGRPPAAGGPRRPGTSRPRDTAARAGEIWRKKLEEVTPPPLDDAIRAELDDVVARRRRELGD